ncbi:MAG: tetratricopeptide repeat protein [Pseudomonadales bacterium]
MTEEEFSPIRPRSVPLSHVQAPDAVVPGQKARALPWKQLLIGTSVVVLLLLVFFVIPDLVGPPVVTRHTAAEPAATDSPGEQSGRNGGAESDAPPPFEALLRQQTREKAQDELSRFVELQMQLENTMQVGTWGQADLDAAKGLATRGDEQFLAEAFEDSLASYRAASDALAALIATGEQMLSDALALGNKALDARDQRTALASFQQALTIDPDNAAAEHGIGRANVLPEVVDLMREAKNHELAGNYRAALETYQRVQGLDPETHDLEVAMATARGGVGEMHFRELLSDGFKAMDAEQFETARSAFNQALAQKPGDPVALGGLEQVAERKDLATIRRLRASAEAFEAAEEWRSAIEDYDRVLALDSNIQFAKSGRARAVEQERTGITLGNIIASPDKLSSTSLYGQAQDILSSAKSIEPRGPKLAAQIARVDDLLATYGTPVPVLFRSDNRTEITLSTVGRLGTFSEKQLSLRPGAYTVIGSRDGCRDVRESILVRPDMAPVEIRCEETF